MRSGIRGSTLVLDNADSFTWNLVGELRRQGDDPRVVRADEWTPAKEGAGIARLLISPGPGRPETNSTAMRVIERHIGRVPLLGICLGHQCLAAHFGASIRRAPLPVHGKTSVVRHRRQSLLENVDDPFRAMRYHSLVVAPESLPPELEIIASCADGSEDVVMGISHVGLPAVGLQFHPESFATAAGATILRNFLQWA